MFIQYQRAYTKNKNCIAKIENKTVSDDKPTTMSSYTKNL